jgi:hypothetical protein
VNGNFSFSVDAAKKRRKDEIPQIDHSAVFNRVKKMTGFASLFNRVDITCDNEEVITNHKINRVKEFDHVVCGCAKGIPEWLQDLCHTLTPAELKLMKFTTFVKPNTWSDHFKNPAKQKEIIYAVLKYAIKGKDKLNEYMLNPTSFKTPEEKKLESERKKMLNLLMQ